MSIRKVLFFIIILAVVVAIPIVYVHTKNVPMTADESAVATTVANPTTDDVQLQSEIDQLFIIGFRGLTYAKSPELSKALSTTNLGGIILFDYDTPTGKYVRNIQTTAQVKSLISAAQSHATTPLLVGLDEEGGAVSRLKTIKGYMKTPSAAVLGTKPDVTITGIAMTLGMTLKNLGFNTDFAPDLDTNVQPTSPAIGAVGRSFSPDANVVAEKAISFMNGLQSDDIISVGKHFPGHGSALTDSHKGFTDIAKTYTQQELIPFQKACAAGLPAIMVGHLFNATVDPNYPATLSKAYVDTLKNIGCGNAVIISDDMDMKAITSMFGRKQSLILAFNAGLDDLILSNNIGGYDPKEYFTARQMVLDAVKEGSIPRSRIDDAYQKVQKLKQTFGLIQ